MATTQQDVIKKFMASLDKTTKEGTDALNEAIAACTNSKYTSIQDVIDKMVLDCKQTNNATNFLKNYCGIDLTNTDTGAITGSDAGGSTVKTAESIVPEVGGLQTYEDNSFTVGGLKFQLNKLTNDINDYSDLNSTYTNLNVYDLDPTQKYMWQALYTWWGKNSLDLIADSYGSNFGFDSDSSATVKTIHVGFVNDSSSSIHAMTSYWWYYDSGISTDLTLKLNMYHYNGMNLSSADGSVSKLGAGFYADRTLSHELTHAVMTANINYFPKLPQFIKEGMAELTHGIDDARKSDIQSLAENPSKLSNSLNVNDTSTGNWEAYAAGYMFLRYLAKQFAGSDVLLRRLKKQKLSNKTRLDERQLFLEK